MKFLDELGDGLDAAASAERTRLDRRRTVARVGGLGVLVAALAVGGFVVGAGGGNGDPALDGERLPVPGDATTSTADSELFEPTDAGPATSVESSRQSDGTDEADTDDPVVDPVVRDDAETDSTADRSDGSASPIPSAAPDPVEDPTDDPDASSGSIDPGTGAQPPTTDGSATSDDTSTSVAPTSAATTTTTTTNTTTTSTSTTEPGSSIAPCAPSATLTADQLDPDGAEPTRWSDQVTVTALTAAGDVGTPIVQRGSIGVDGGRYDFQVDLIPADDGAPATEAIVLRFDEPVCAIELGIAMLEVDEFDGLDESFEWSAVGADGDVVGTGVRSAGEIDEVRGIRRFDAPIDVPAVELTLRPVAYGAGAEPSAAPNNSDFGLAELIIRSS